MKEYTFFLKDIGIEFEAYGDNAQEAFENDIVPLGYDDIAEVTIVRSNAVELA